MWSTVVPREKHEIKNKTRQPKQKVALCNPAHKLEVILREKPRAVLVAE
jgi:hypothetical protein